MSNVKLLEIALSQYGVREIRGEKHNPIILNYFKDIGQEWVKDDETAWCSCFMNWVAMQAGKERTEKLNARSWLGVGEDVERPEIGDVVIFWRESIESWKGHVGLFISRVDDEIYVLGGNQDNMVSIKPYHVSRLMGYRRLQNV